MTMSAAPLPPCPECGQGMLHYSSHDAAYDKCPDGHIANLRTYLHEWPVEAEEGGA